MATRDLIAHIASLETLRDHALAAVETVISQIKKPHPAITDLHEEIVKMVAEEDRTNLVADEAGLVDVSDMPPASVPAAMIVQEQINALKNHMNLFSNDKFSTADVVARLEAILKKISG